VLGGRLRQFADLCALKRKQIRCAIGKRRARERRQRRRQPAPDESAGDKQGGEDAEGRRFDRLRLPNHCSGFAPPAVPIHD